jgi:predicted transcriptional regulator
MSNTLTVRLPDELLEELRRRARRMRMPVGRIVRHSLENTFAEDENIRLLELAGLIKGGPRDLSSRKGFSRK